MKIIAGSIDLSKIDKTRIKEGKNGAKYYDISIIVNDEMNQYGQDVSITTGQTKEERAAKEKATYIGNGKTVYTSDPKPLPGEANGNTFNDGLPF